MRLVTTLIVLVTLSGFASGQSAYWFIRSNSSTGQEVSRVDKNRTPALSERALERRRKQGIELRSTDYSHRDPAFEQLLRRNGFRIRGYSRWLDAYSAEPLPGVQRTEDIKPLLFQLGYRMEPVHSLSSGSVEYNIPYLNREMLMPAPPPADHWYDYGEAWNQTHMVHGEVLHDEGYEGQSKVIAILDGSFYQSNLIGGLQRAYDEGRVLAAYNFVNGDTNVYRAVGTHGTSVWSVMGTQMDGRLVGSAPRASYVLLVSEDDENESKVEEDYWVMAVEFADSIGADVINSSLGYNTFDTDPDYSPEDMDGRTATVTYGAVMAHRAGMVVVSSAGNTGAGSWRIISAPADADSILAIGAVDSTRVVSPFSGRGPSADGRVKPDVMAQGVLTAILNSIGQVDRGNGTSFASPVIAGFAACLWEAVPGATNYEIMNAIRQSADRFTLPNEDYGYGIPDFRLALELVGVNEPRSVRLYPNPASDKLRLHLPSDAEAVYTIVSLEGKVVQSGTLAFPQNDHVVLSAGLSNGMYILHLEQSGESHRFKFHLLR